MLERTLLLPVFACVTWSLIACGSVSTIPLANCAWVEPPTASGEEMHTGAKLLIFPRAKQMGFAYSGCQSVWIDVGDKRPRLIGRFRYERGRYVGYSAPIDGRPEALVCSYRNGRLIAGDANDCESDDSGPMPSMPAGCFEPMRLEAATGRPAPKACHLYE